MIIRSLSPRRFGCLADGEIEFSSGLNVIYGPNEAGKSTLQTALLTALFEKVTSRDQDRVLRWQRWGVGEMYQLTVRFSAAGEEWELLKSFADKRVCLTNLSTGAIFSEGNAVQEKLGEMLGTSSRMVYESTAAVRQQQMLAIAAEQQIGEMLQASISGSGVNVSVSEVSKKLDNALTDMRRGWDRPAPKNPGLLRIAQDKIDRLKTELSKLQSNSQEVQQARERLEECKKELEQLEPDVEQRKQFLERVQQRRKLQTDLEETNDKWQELHERVQQAEKLQEEIKQLTSKLDSLPLVSEQEVAEVKGLTGGITHVATAIHSLKQKLEELKSRQQEIQAQVRELAGADSPAQVQHKALRLQENLTTAQSKLAKHGEQIRDIDQSWQIARVKNKRRVTAVLGSALIAIVGGIGAALVSPWWWLLFGVGGLLALVGALMWRGESVANLLSRCPQVQSNLAANEQQLEEVWQDLSNLQKCGSEIKQKQAGLQGVLGSKVLQELQQRCDDLALERATIQAQLDSPELAHIALDSSEEDKLRNSLQQDEARLRQLERDRIKAQTNIEDPDYDAEQELRTKEQLAEAQQHLAQLQGRAQTYELTHKVLEIAHQQTLQGLTEPLVQQVAQMLRVLTGGRYHQVSVNRETLQPKVFSADKGAEADPQQDLSCATAEQLYLAARLGLAQLLWPGEGPPLLLDDPLVNFDDQRRAAAAVLLRDLAHARQILLFTHSDEYDAYADQVVRLPGPSAPAMSNDSHEL